MTAWTNTTATDTTINHPFTYEVLSEQYDYYTGEFIASWCWCATDDREVALEEYNRMKAAYCDNPEDWGRYLRPRIEIEGQVFTGESHWDLTIWYHGPEGNNCMEALALWIG